MNKFIWLFLLIACNPASPSSETKPSQLTEMSIFDQLISQATHIIRAEVTELEASFNHNRRTSGFNNFSHIK